MIRFKKALDTRLSGLKNEEKGFTLIELLVVVIIIGILAAIAVPIYLGVQQSSKDAAVNTDVGNAKIAVVAYQTDNPGATTAPALTAAVLGKYGFTLSSTNTASLAYSGTAAWPSFCIVGTASSGSPATKFWATDSTGSVKAAAAPTGC